MCTELGRSNRSRPGTVRLDRALSKLGIASRAAAQRLILDGRVSVGGRIIRDPSIAIVPETARIAVDRQAAARVAWRTIAFHKPRGVVTTRRDPERRPTVFDVLGEETSRSLVTAGRLDLASTGLLILTTDTQLANYLTDPANEIVRTYAVTVRGRFDDEGARRMAHGLEGLTARSVVVRKRSARESHLIVELTEGRNREIRRMLDALGHEVTRLMRVAFGPIELDTLQPGHWREIDAAEIRQAFPHAPLDKMRGWPSG